jgi:hypothetical protein
MKIAFVTPSYRGDLERCRLLCESTTRFLPRDFEHVLLIDRRDIELFKPLQSDVVRIVESESLVPWWIFRVPGIKKFRISLQTPPLRNWIFQQILKLSAVNATDADVLHFVDSDVVLTKPFDRNYIVRDGKVRLQHTGRVGAEHDRWLKIAARLLAIKDKEAPRGNYVGNFITWKADNVRAMHRHIEKHNFGSWVRAVGSELHFSEYMIYGTFIDHVLGLDASGHFHDDRPNLYLSWGYEVETAEGLDRFFRERPEDSFGLMIHSKLGVQATDYEQRVRALWARYD